MRAVGEEDIMMIGKLCFAFRAAAFGSVVPGFGVPVETAAAPGLEALRNRLSFSWYDF
jgi:hypothetical protein